MDVFTVIKLREAIQNARSPLTVILAHPRSGKTTAVKEAQFRPRRILLDDPFDRQMTDVQLSRYVEAILSLSVPTRVVVVGTPLPETRFAWQLLIDRADNVHRLPGEPVPDFRLMAGEDFCRVACDLVTDPEAAV